MRRFRHVLTNQVSTTGCSLATLGAWVQAALLATSVMACQGQVSREPPIHPNLNMDFQKRLDPQVEETFFEDGRAMRIPPAGTVATTLADDDIHLQADGHLYRGIVDGQFASALPRGIELTEANLQRGQERYGIYCAVCHGEAGDGESVLKQRKVNMPAPTYHDQRLRSQPVGYFYSVITNGIRSMSPYKSHMSVEDRWLVAAYVKALQVSQQAPRDLVPADVAATKGWR